MKFFTLLIPEEDGMGIELVYGIKVRQSENAKERVSKGLSQVKLQFRSTMDIIKSIEAGNFPNSVMFTFHPQRWTDKWLPWTKELLWQNVKNVVKKFLIEMSDKR